ncbi:MAG: DUF1292 domain-containing protein [Clostridia bacterium]|nr:DUF1292 domain-containing protein [Clostridia bacterium]MBQ9189130.1 DUF1292 domain-containing protein [Clostridia bacterium]
MEENNSIITLVDDNGVEADFDLVCTFDYEGRKFAAMFPLGNVEGVADDEVVILEIVKNGDGESLVPIENEILLNEVFNEFMEIFEDMADGEDDEEE